MPETSNSSSTAKIVEWDEQKGYGFLQAGKGRIFLHRRDFVERHKRPAIGDVIRYTVGQDLKGRPCAKNAAHVNAGGKITMLTLLLLAGLLILPAMALHRLAVDFRGAGLYVLVLSLASYCFYANDKRRAQEKGRRISENTLQLTALLGGWPGAFLAQRQLRHKVSKPGFLFVFWLIVLAYQFAAFDSLRNWEFSKQTWNHIQKLEIRRN